MEAEIKYRQILAGVLANLASFSAGLTMGWSSPSIPNLRNPDPDINPLGRVPSIAEISWMTSLVPCGALISPFLAGPMTKIIGRKSTLMSSAIFFSASFVLLAFGKCVEIIYVARILQGFGVGICTTACAMYIGEIASVSYRGALGSLMQLFLSIGILFPYAVGPYVSYVSLQWICLTIPITFAVLFYFMPESPNYLLSKGRTQDAIDALTYLRGNTDDKIERELADIQMDIDHSERNKGSLKELVTNRGNLRAFIIACGLLCAQQACGIDVVLFNSQTIFERTGSDISPEIATILIGIVQIVVSIVIVFVVEKLGRKLLLLVSLAMMAVTAFTMGIFFYLDHIKSPIIGSILWVPVTSLLIFVIGFNVGIGPVPWAILGELFPVNVKSYAATIATSICWGTSFVLILGFESVNESLGPYWSFWIFTITCTAAFLFTYCMLFETKGLTFQEIQNKLNKRRN